MFRNMQNAEIIRKMTEEFDEVQHFTVYINCLLVLVNGEYVDYFKFCFDFVLSMREFILFSHLCDNPCCYFQNESSLEILLHCMEIVALNND